MVFNHALVKIKQTYKKEEDIDIKIFWMQLNRINRLESNLCNYNHISVHLALFFKTGLHGVCKSHHEIYFVYISDVS